MIAEFADSWPLFHNAYLAGWLIAVLLSVAGVAVVARDRIFIGAALSQASTFGIAVGMWGGAALSSDPESPVRSADFLSLLAVAFAVAAALATMRGGGRGSREAVTGWVFLGSASFSILLLAHSPHGLEEIHHLVSSSIIGARPSDVWQFALMALATCGFVALRLERLTLFLMDPALAGALGMRTVRWDALVSVWLGLAVGFSMRVSGMLYTFGCLVLPGLAAANLCRETRSMFAVAPLLALACAGAGFVLAKRFDDPPAQMAVALLSVVWLAGMALGRLRR